MVTCSLFALGKIKTNRLPSFTNIGNTIYRDICSLFKYIVQALNTDLDSTKFWENHIIRFFLLFVKIFL